MRINKFVAQATGMSRRAADQAITEGRVKFNGQKPGPGDQVTNADSVTLDGTVLGLASQYTTIMLNKPVGYVCSRTGQGSQTIYDLIPESLHTLKAVGRLDKHSSGLLLMTDDGQLAYELTHPKFEKLKTYKIAVNKDLSPEDYRKITTEGVMLDDGVSKFGLEPINNQRKEWKVTMTEGRNRQIRRTLEALGYRVVKLHRVTFGSYRLESLPPGKFIQK